MVPKLEIDDPSLIPFEINGARLLIPDTKVITLLLKAGTKVPGCRMVQVPQTQAKPWARAEVG